MHTHFGNLFFLVFQLWLFWKDDATSGIYQIIQICLRKVLVHIYSSLLHTFKVFIIHFTLKHYPSLFAFGQLWFQLELDRCFCNCVECQQTWLHLHSWLSENGVHPQYIQTAVFQTTRCVALSVRLMNKQPGKRHGRKCLEGSDFLAQLMGWNLYARGSRK